LLSEAENNLVLGVARRFLDEPASENPPCYWASVVHDGEVMGCALRTPPYRLSLTRLPSTAIAILVENVREVYQHLPGVVGPIEVATQFAEAWSRLAGATWGVRTRLRIHTLTNVTVPEDSPNGELRRPSDAEFDLIRQWAAAFVNDTGISDDPSAVANRLQASPKLYVWDDYGPRCMVAAARETPHGACVIAVYTPPIYRERGYASAAVAALSRKFLAEGKTFCCLYADTANPTSNSIYQKIGFKPGREDVDIDFSTQ